VTQALLNACRPLLDAYSGELLDANTARLAPQYVENVKFTGAGSASLAIPATGPGGAAATIVVLKSTGGNGYVKAYTGSAPTWPGATTSDGSGFEIIGGNQGLMYRLDPGFIGSVPIVGLELYMDAAGYISAAWYFGGKAA
jgi:hypothetical protein